MNPSEMSFDDDGYDPPAEDDDSAGDRSLLGSLGLLLLAIDDDGGPAGDYSGPAIRWEDERYVYFEAEIPGGDAGSVDVSVFDGKAFVRLQK